MRNNFTVSDYLSLLSAILWYASVVSLHRCSPQDALDCSTSLTQMVQ